MDVGAQRDGCTSLDADGSLREHPLRSDLERRLRLLVARILWELGRDPDLRIGVVSETVPKLIPREGKPGVYVVASEGGASS